MKPGAKPNSTYVRVFNVPIFYPVLCVISSENEGNERKKLGFFEKNRISRFSRGQSERIREPLSFDMMEIKP